MTRNISRYQQLLVQTLLENFDRPGLDQLLQFTLSVRLDDIAYWHGNEKTYHDLITTAEQEGWLFAFIAEVAFKRGSDPTLKALYDELKPQLTPDQIVLYEGTDAESQEQRRQFVQAQRQKKYTRPAEEQLTEKVEEFRGEISSSDSHKPHILVIPLKGKLSFNVDPHIYFCTALRTRIDSLDLANAPVLLEVPDRPITNQNEARTLGGRHKATLVIWGIVDDIVGIQPLVEIMDKAPTLCLRQLGFWLPVMSLVPPQIKIAKLPNEAIIDQLADYADDLALLSVGIALTMVQQGAQAEGLFTNIIEKAQIKESWSYRTYEAYYWRGFVHSMQEFHQTAWGDLIKALTLYPKSKYALTQRGNVNLIMGSAKEAQIDFQEALTSVPLKDQADRVVLYNNIGLALELQNEPENAFLFYQQAWQIRQKDDSAALIYDLIHFGNFCQRQRLFEEAIDFYNMTLNLCKQKNFDLGEAEALSHIGLIHHIQGRGDDALKFYHDALTIYEKNTRNCLERALQLIWLGLLHLKLKETENAQTRLYKALNISKKVGSIYGQAQAQIGIGLTVRQKGNVPNAQAMFQQAEKSLDKIGSPEAEVARLAIQQFRGERRIETKTKLYHATPFVKVQKEHLIACLRGSDIAYLCIELMEQSNHSDFLEEILRLNDIETTRNRDLRKKISQFTHDLSNAT